MLGRRRVVVDDRRPVALRGRAVPAARAELVRSDAPADVADHARAEDDRRERQVEREDRDERRRGDRPQRGAPQRARADPPRGEEDDRGHRRLDAVEHARHRRHRAERDVDPRERDQDEERGQDEQRAGDDPAARAVHQPADVGGELLRLRPRQHHAVVERVQEAALGDPAPPLDQLLVHDRDLPGRPAEADEAELQPEPERLAEGNRRRRAHRIASRRRTRAWRRTSSTTGQRGEPRRAKRSEAGDRRNDGVHGKPPVAQRLDGTPSWEAGSLRSRLCSRRRTIRPRRAAVKRPRPCSSAAQPAGIPTSGSTARGRRGCRASGARSRR